LGNSIPDWRIATISVVILFAPVAALLQVIVLPWLPLWRAHGRGVSHPLTSLIVLVLICALIAVAFRRRAS